MDTNRLQEKFQEELALVRNIPAHPHILHMFVLFTGTLDTAAMPDWTADEVHEKTCCLVSQLVAGPTLKALTRDREAERGTGQPLFSRQEFISVFGGLASALAHLYTHGIVHRDVKTGRMCILYEHAFFSFIFLFTIL